MAKNGAKKGVYLILQSKEGLEKLKVRAILETSNIKAELSSVRKGEEIVENEQYEVDNLKIQLDEIRAEIIKTDRLEMWAQYM